MRAPPTQSGRDPRTWPDAARRGKCYAAVRRGTGDLRTDMHTPARGRICLLENKLRNRGEGDHCFQGEGAEEVEGQGLEARLLKL